MVVHVAIATAHRLRYTVPMPAEPQFKRHVFVCQNRRDGSDGRPSCAERQSEAIFHALKAGQRQHPELRGKVRINKSGCLDICDYGPAIVVYPEGTWYSGVTPEDVPEIVASHVVNGEPVERLRHRARPPVKPTKET